MDLKTLVDLLNEDLKHEYQHMLFYTHAANVLVGMERMYLADKLKEHAKSEMDHVFQFANKIRANGGVPVSGSNTIEMPLPPNKAYGIIDFAIKLEKEVVNNYHIRHEQASRLYAETGKHYDLVVFLEEQIEHSQGDIDEFTIIMMGL